MRLDLFRNWAQIEFFLGGSVALGKYLGSFEGPIESSVHFGSSSEKKDQNFVCQPKPFVILFSVERPRTCNFRLNDHIQVTMTLLLWRERGANKLPNCTVPATASSQGLPPRSAECAAGAEFSAHPVLYFMHNTGFEIWYVPLLLS